MDNSDCQQFYWTYNEESISTYDVGGDYFYRIFMNILGTGESELEGESLTEIIVLKGEYGEYPSGELFSIGKFYNPKIIETTFERGQFQVVVESGPFEARNQKSYKLTNSISSF